VRLAHGLDRVGLLEDESRPPHHLVARRSEGRRARASLEDRNAQLALELGQLSAQGRLAPETDRGRPPEVLQIGDRHQVSKVTQVHRSSASPFAIGSSYDVH
jgi:hypothetical protein